MTHALWIVQVLLALLFLFAGGMKLVLPIEELTAQMPLPGWFVRFIGVAELLGALGLILPGLLRIRPGLTPLAAAGLVSIMIGATAVTAIMMDPAMALMPLVVGFLAAFVAYGRWQLAPIRGRSAAPALQTAQVQSRPHPGRVGATRRPAAHCVTMAFGPAAGLELVDALTTEPSLKTYHLLPSVRGDVLARLGRAGEASARYRSLETPASASCSSSAAPRARAD